MDSSVASLSNNGDWVPLPPRDESHRERRRRKRNDQAATDRPVKPQRRPNRPGFNSYLKVVLDDESLSRLRQMTLQIQDRFSKDQRDKDSAAVADHDNNDDAAAVAAVDPTGEDDAATSGASSSLHSKKNPKKRPEKRLTIKPRSLDSLHMTFFFGGETLCELPSEELLDFHAQVSEILKQRGFVQGEESTVEAAANESPAAGESGGVDHDDDGDSSAVLARDDPFQCFRVAQVRLFPPRRNNLIVAVLDAPDLWCQLHDDIRSAAKNGSSQALREITTYSENRWTPHVTLANLFGGTKAELAQLRELLQEITEEETSKAPFLARGCYVDMGGPVPEQIELDWRFSYTTRRPSEPTI